jgi:hypothetical protein
MIKVILSNGYAYSGIIISETDSELILKDVKDKIVNIKKSAIIVREEQDGS